jgi:hypothetical protein
VTSQFAYLLVVGLVPVGMALVLMVVTRLEGSLPPKVGTQGPLAE